MFYLKSWSICHESNDDDTLCGICCTGNSAIRRRIEELYAVIEDDVCDYRLCT